MRNPILLTLALLLASASQAQQLGHDDEHPFIMPGTPAKTIPAPTPWFTGAQLLRQLQLPEHVDAVKYVMGVYDATESGLWCYTDYGRARHQSSRPRSCAGRRSTS